MKKYELVLKQGHLLQPRFFSMISYYVIFVRSTLNCICTSWYSTLRDGMTSYMSTLKHGRFTLTDALLFAALKGKECTVQKKPSENKDSRCWNDRVTPWKQKPGNYHYIAKILIIIFKTLKLQRQTTDSSLSSKILCFKVICKRTAHASVWILEQF